jgi:16S rRNA C1402 (ribose-2'-O) methylase RsmI
LTYLGEVIGLERPVAVARELTKAHEELVIRPINELLAHFSIPRGEFTVMLPPLDRPAPSPALPDADALVTEFVYLTKNGSLKRREAMKVLADRYGLGVNALYKLLGDAGS